MTKTVLVEPATVVSLLEQVSGGNEIAPIDTRPLPSYTLGHAFWAASVRTADQAHALLPRRDVPVVVFDGDPTLAQAWGYRNVMVLNGGTAAWARSGQRVYGNRCVPSKALAEAARVGFAIPTVTVAATIAQQQSASPRMVIDVRSPQEFAAGSLPNSINIPGGELAAQAAQFRTAGYAITTHCAGRTRALFAAQSLRDDGVTDVLALAGGTTAWSAAGQRLVVHPPVADEPPLAAAPAETGDRTRYLIDVGMIPNHAGAQHIPAGQLVEAMDEYLPVLGAQVMIADADDPRSLSIARWLARAGAYEVSLLTADGGVVGVPGGHHRPVSPPPADPVVDPDLPSAPAPDPHGPPAPYARWSEALPSWAATEPGPKFRL